jgi:fatty acid desaturase
MWHLPRTHFETVCILAEAEAMHAVRATLVVAKFGLTNFLLVALIAALAAGNPWIWAVLAATMLISGVFDEALGDRRFSLGTSGRVFYNANLLAALPLVAILAILLARISASAATGFYDQAPSEFPTALTRTLMSNSGAILAATFAAGYFFSLAGITVAHELTHRTNSKVALLSARILCAFTFDPSFEVYHVHFHHQNVGLIDDPATARRGEIVYAFLIRTIIGQWRQAWRYEATRLRLKRKNIFSMQNRIVNGIYCTLAILMIAAAVGGFPAVIALIVAGITGRILHALVDYVQHYGLVRVAGKPIEPRHSWDCHRAVSSVLLYNLVRHADHHAFAGKAFWNLETLDTSPKLPRGYTTMVMIALVPPLWRSVLSPLLVDWDGRLASDEERALLQNFAAESLWLSQAQQAAVRQAGHSRQP